MSDHIPDDFTSYLLSEFKCASLRARLMAADLDAIGVAPKGHLISADDALAHLSDCDALRLIAPLAVTTSTST